MVASMIKRIRLLWALHVEFVLDKVAPEYVFFRIPPVSPGNHHSIIDSYSSSTDPTGVR
jgi:hypothetical protein